MHLGQDCLLLNNNSLPTAHSCIANVTLILSIWRLENCLKNDKNVSKIEHIFCSSKVQTEIRKLCISELFKKNLQLI
jgi:hypothetical protein